MKRPLLRELPRRTYLKLGSTALAGTALSSSVSSAASRGGSIVAENRRSGDAGWRPTEEANTRPEAVDHLIEGYTREPSIEPGGTVEFRVSTADAESYRIDIYRLGWYDGAGGRLVTSLPADGEESSGQKQPIPDPDPETGLLECDWDVTDTLDVPKQWTTGLYLARFVLTSGENEGESTAHSFVVTERPDRKRSSKIVVQLPIATSQAYNGWGGKSLYGTFSDGSPGDIVSFDRPIAGAPTNHMIYAIHLLRFLEAEGYDVSYVTNLDVYRDPNRLQEHELAISAGHDEYWSKEEYDAFENARDNGTNLAFLGGNSAFWQVRYEDDGQTMICYKETVEEDPLYGTGLETDLFRNLGRPECELLGVMSVGAGLYNLPDYTVQEEAMDHPWMADTGFEPGDKIVGVIGHEWDWIRDDCDVPGELTNFFHYEEGSSDLWIVNDQDADAVAYETPSGTRVFSAGTLGYTYRLDPDPSWNVTWPYTRVQEYKPEVLESDPRLQQFQRNVFDDLQRGTN